MRLSDGLGGNEHGRIELYLAVGSFRENRDVIKITKKIRSSSVNARYVRSQCGRVFYVAQ